MLELIAVHKSFGPHRVLEDINLHIARGEVFGFLGPNGAGKTTLIRIILGLVRPDHGTVRINGYNIHTDFYKAIACVGAVVETPKFYNQLTGRQNMALMANLHRDVPRQRIEEVLATVGLLKQANDKVATYSLGMKQRLGIARALVHNPRLVFLDEPMNGLDPQGMFEVRELIANMADHYRTAFFITSHLLHEIEQVCANIAVIQAGKIIRQGQVAALLGKQTEEVCVMTGSVAKACALLKDLDYVRHVHVGDGQLRVELNKGCSGQLNKALVHHDIDVDYIIPRQQSLEDFYLELMSEGSGID